MIIYDWDRSFENIGIVLEPRIVRVLNDDAFVEKIRKGGRRYARAVARHAVNSYQARYGDRLQITEKSLACEIYWHSRMKEIAERIERRRGEKKFTRWIVLHMDVIDCGERKEDNNRLLWDLLSLIF